MPGELLEHKLRERLRSYDRDLNGVLGVAAIDLTSGRLLVHNGDTVFPTASTIKVPILIEMFRLARTTGEFKMSDSITLQPKETVGGSGRIQQDLRKGPVTLTVLDLLTAMIQYSDNTATNRAIAMARMERVNRRTQELGMQFTRLRRIMLDSEAATKGMENVSTPTEMSRLMEMIYRGKACAADAQDDCKEMMRILKLVKGQIRGSVPAEIEVASKTGDLVGVKCETAVVLHPRRPYVISVFGSYLRGEESPVAQVARMFFEYYDVLGSANAYGNRGVR
jgi:beta-lactamase class A